MEIYLSVGRVYQMEAPNKALHRMAIPLRSIAAGELCHSPYPFLSLHRHGIIMPLD